MRPAPEAVIAPLIGSPYHEPGTLEPAVGFDCFSLVRYCYAQGLGIELDAQPSANLHLLEEVWFDGDAALAVEPWDLLVLRLHSGAGEHLGLAMNAAQFVHVRRGIGTCLEPLSRWHSRLLQVVRLRPAYRTWPSD